MILVVFIIIGFPIGYVVGRMSRNKGLGEAGNTVLGIAGAILSGYLFNALNLSFLVTIGMSAVGAVALLFVVNAFLLKR